VGWEGEWTKAELVGCDKDKDDKGRNNNNNNKEHAKQIIHDRISLTTRQSIAHSLSPSSCMQHAELTDFAEPAEKFLPPGQPSFINRT